MLIIVVPAVLFFVERSPMISEMQDELDKPFACPNCGHRFTIRMIQVWYRLPSFHVLNGFRVKCPKCNRKDVCIHPYDE